jgi:hypothetical protein
MFRNEVAPFIALAYLRIREPGGLNERGLRPAIAFFQETVIRFVTLLRERLSSPDDREFPSTQRMKRFERRLAGLEGSMNSFFSTHQPVGYRDFEAIQFLEFVRDERDHPY